MKYVCSWKLKLLEVLVIAIKIGAVAEMTVHGETDLLVKPNDEHELAK